MGFLPRRSLDVSQNEIARAYKLSNRDIQPLSFIVPRKAEGFQADIFPPANSSEPATTASEWFGGKDARPNLIDLETRAVSANKAPLSTPKPSTPAASTPKAQSPKLEAKEEPKPAAKEEPKPEPKAATPPPKEEPKATPPPKEEPKEKELSSKDLEIEQADSSEDESPKATKAALGVASAVGGGAALGAAALAAKSPAASSGAATPAANGGSANDSDDLLVKLLTSDATLPSRGSSLSAGHDLYASADISVPARGKALVSTGISIAVPVGTYGRIAPRSGLAAKHSIDTGAGVIDADYRGEVKVLLFNYGDSDFAVAKGDRIAQLILEKVHMGNVRQVDDLEATTRGAGGFGSTGGFGRS